MLKLTLPWSPSVNNYYGGSGRTRFLLPKVTEFRRKVASCIPLDHETLTGPLRLLVEAYPPNKRRHDLDNLLKGTQDSLEAAKVYENDFQINDVQVKRMDIFKDGKLEITITELD